MSLSVATSCTYAMCDPMVSVPMGPGQGSVFEPYSVAKANGAKSFQIYKGAMTCAIGTAKVCKMCGYTHICACKYVINVHG